MGGGHTPPTPTPVYFDFALRHAPGSKSDSAPHNKMAARFKKKAIINGFPKVYLGHRLKQASDLQI